MKCICMYISNIICICCYVHALLFSITSIKNSINIEFYKFYKSCYSADTHNSSNCGCYMMFVSNISFYGCF